ncbi:Uridine phosphorylase [Richelia intracellularis]|nr:Uridine phosphorylase [Richelia intracellularis]
MAIIATVNLGLVMFDLSYIHWRNFYFKNFPEITQRYDLMKGIEPHRDTEKYLTTVDELQAAIELSGLQSQGAKKKLSELRSLSIEMIDNDPFAGVGKTGSLEKIKRNMRDRIAAARNGDKISSSKEAFNIFWSQDYLLSQGWGREKVFMNRKIRPLIASNYFRHIDENGKFVDLFWILDLPFVALFGLEFVIRSLWLKRRHPNFSYLSVMLWHWYDLWLILPLWRWTRIVPVLFRLEKAELWRMHQLRRQAQQLIVANFAEEITEMVVVRVINQTQTSIRRGELTRWLLQGDNLRPYVDINNVNEIEAIAGIFVQALIYQVIPQIKPEIATILQYQINTVLNQTPIYRNLQNLPGLGKMQTQLSEELATQITSNVYQALVSSVEDPISAELSSQLMERFTKVLGGEMQKKHVLSEIQNLFIDFLEEVKLNYVQQLSEEEIEEILDRTSQLRTQTSVKPLLDSSNSLKK